MDNFDYEVDEYDYEEEQNYLTIEEEKARLMNQQELYAEFQNKILEIADLIGTTQQIALNVLIFYNFDFKKLENEYLVEENEQGKKKISMIEQGIFQTTDVQVVQINTCQICMSEQPKGLYLNCGHIFCESCWKQMIDVQFANFIPLVNCLQDQCKQRLPHTFLEQYDQYKKILIKRLMYSDSSITWCPGLGCENVFKCPRFQKAVKCLCGIKFCSKCRNEKHYPVPCDILKRIFGLKESNDHWVNLNTTSCPKCGRFVQKTQGCNHLKCICQQHFCFVCGKSWEKDHEKSFYECPYEKQQENFSLSAEQLLEETKCLTKRYRDLEKQIKSFPLTFHKVKISFLLSPLHRLLKLLQIQKWFAFYNYTLNNSKEVFQKHYLKYASQLEEFCQGLDYFFVSLEDIEFDEEMIEIIYPTLPDEYKKKLQDLVILKQSLCQQILKQIQ